MTGKKNLSWSKVFFTTGNFKAGIILSLSLSLICQDLLAYHILLQMVHLSKSITVVQRVLRVGLTFLVYLF